MGTSYSTKPHTNLLAFAQYAINQFKLKCIGGMANILFRVDIFINQYGQFKVNEFESFEANHSSLNLVLYSEVRQFLRYFWYNKLKEILQTKATAIGL